MMREMFEPILALLYLFVFMSG